MPIGLGIGLNISMRGGLGGGLSITAPELAFASATDPDSDNTQDFNATFSEDIEGYYVRLVGSYGATTVSEPYDIDQFNLIDGSEAGLLLATFLTGAIPNGDVAFKCRIQSGAGDGTGTAVSDWSNTVTKEIDQPAPTLTSPVDTVTSSTTASGGVTTDISGGTLYAVVTTSATPPSAAQIKAGTDHADAAAADAVSQAVSATGAQTITGGFTGLLSGTAYYTYFVQETVIGFSNVAAADGFTTATTTWNPSDTAALHSFSGGNLTLTRITTNTRYAKTRAIDSHSTGKYYFEIKYIYTGTGMSAGIANSSETLDSGTFYLGNDTNGVAVGANAQTTFNNANLGSPGTVVSNQWMGIAVDLTNKKIWTIQSGGNWNNAAIGSQDPANDVGGYSFATIAAGPYFPIVQTYRTSDHSTVANFGGSAYTFTPPTGFANW